MCSICALLTLDNAVCSYVNVRVNLHNAQCEQDSQAWSSIVGGVTFFLLQLLDAWVFMLLSAEKK